MKKIITLIALFSIATWTYSSNSDVVGSTSSPKQEVKAENTMTLVVTINGVSVVHLKNTPLKGYLEVYSILGKREKQIKLDNCEGQISIDLSKGLYILKAEKVTQKIVVR